MKWIYFHLEEEEITIDFSNNFVHIAYNLYISIWILCAQREKESETDRI